MHPDWQQINVRWLFCHWWRDLDRRSITAMTFLMIALAVAVLLMIATIRAIRHDGFGPQRPPASHFEDDRFLSFGAR